MAIDIEYSTYMEIVADIISLIQMEEFERFDSIEQAKRFCIKNDYDFGLY